MAYRPPQSPLSTRCLSPSRTCRSRVDHAQCDKQRGFPSPEPTRQWTRVTAYQHMAIRREPPRQAKPAQQLRPRWATSWRRAPLSVVEGIATRPPWPPRVRLRQTRSAVQRDHGRPHPPRPLDGDKRFAIARSPQRRSEVSVRPTRRGRAPEGQGYPSWGTSPMRL
jgi:hypothetical protein